MTLLTRQLLIAALLANYRRFHPPAPITLPKLRFLQMTTAHKIMQERRNVLSQLANQ